MRAGLLPTSTPRSDDSSSEACSDDADVRAAELPLHPITGTFADPQLAAEFASMLFRSMFPIHAAGMGLLCCATLPATIIVARDDPGNAASCALYGILAALGLCARVAVHRWEDRTRAQALGALAWAIMNVAGLALDLIELALLPAEYCAEDRTPAAVYAYPLYMAVFALLNASHGLDFWHASALVGLTLFDGIALAVACSSPASANLAIGSLVVMAPTAHFMQVLARRDFLRFHYLRESRDRLDLLAQLSSHRGRLAATRVAVLRETGHSDPEHSSASTASAPPRATRSAPSRVRFALPATASGDAVPSQPGAVATEPQAAGSGAAGPSGHSCQPDAMPQPWPAQGEAGPSTSADTGPAPRHPDERLLHQPLFTVTPGEAHRLQRLVAQRNAERLGREQDDQASDAMSHDAGAPAPQGDPHEWSTTASSAPSTATRNQRRRQREIEALRQGTFTLPTRHQTRHNPYFSI